MIPVQPQTALRKGWPVTASSLPELEPTSGDSRELFARAKAPVVAALAVLLTTRPVRASILSRK